MTPPSEARPSDLLFSLETISQPPRDLMPGTSGSVSMLEFLAVDAQEQQAKAEAEQTQSYTDDRATQMRVMIDRAREESAEETRRQMEASTEARVLAERQRILDVCTLFAAQRERYFSSAEEQVVRLALAIAARVLHRESTADPHLLQATVRAALARLQEGSAAVLRIPPSELGMWEQTFPSGHQPAVQVLSDDRMKPGDCALETAVGRVEMGVAVQLDEVARGFAELTDPAYEDQQQLEG